MSQRTKETVQRAYDAIADYWNQYLMQEPYYWANDFVDFIERVERGRILELACGVGREAALLSGIDGLDYHGVDISEESLKLAKEKNPDGKFHKADVTDLCFPNMSFDGFWSVALFHHLEREEASRTLTEISRVCIPGAPGFIQTAAGEGETLVSIPQAPGLEVLVVRWNPEQFIDLLASHGFDVNRVTYQNDHLSLHVTKRLV